MEPPGDEHHASDCPSLREIDEPFEAVDITSAAAVRVGADISTSCRPILTYAEQRHSRNRFAADIQNVVVQNATRVANSLKISVCWKPAAPTPATASAAARPQLETVCSWWPKRSETMSVTGPLSRDAPLT